jgi:hypothetical protein
MAYTLRNRLQASWVETGSKARNRAVRDNNPDTTLSRRPPHHLKLRPPLLHICRLKLQLGHSI